MQTMAIKTRKIDPATHLLFEADCDAYGKLVNERVIASVVIRHDLGVWDDWPTVTYTVTEVCSGNDVRAWATVGYAEAYRYRKDGGWESTDPAEVTKNATAITTAEFKAHWRWMRLPNFRGKTA